MESLSVQSEFNIKPEEFELLYGKSLSEDIEVDDPELLVKNRE